MGVLLIGSSIRIGILQREIKRNPPHDGKCPEKQVGSYAQQAFTTDRNILLAIAIASIEYLDFIEITES
jgi:hypothetical protein